ncbi:MAG: ABC transporter ATP-binding protein, partial [Bdellovibrionia bacterium]
MIEIRDLTKSYGNTNAIKSLNFSVKKGEVVGFLGPNGAGKTTTMKIITGYMAPTTGSVKVAGFDVFEHPIEVKRRIGYLPETPPLHPDMYVRDYLAFVARLKGVPKAKVKAAVDGALEKAVLTDVQKRLIANLSKGYRQRVGIAQALVSEPELLILDEPTVGLDPKQVAEIRRLIQGLRGHHTIVLSTHILPEVQATCERIIIINQGSIVAEDTLAGLNERMHGAKRVMIKVRRPSDSLVVTLRAVDGVRHIDLSPDKKTIQVDLEPGED